LLENLDKTINTHNKNEKETPIPYPNANGQ